MTGFVRPSLRDSNSIDHSPGVETPGYYRDVPPGHISIEFPKGTRQKTRPVRARAVGLLRKFLASPSALLWAVMSDAFGLSVTAGFSRSPNVNACWMKKCAYCGRENLDDATHCSECGTAEFAAPKPPVLPVASRPKMLTDTVGVLPCLDLFCAILAQANGARTSVCRKVGKRRNLQISKRRSAVPVFLRDKSRDGVWTF